MSQDNRKTRTPVQDRAIEKKNHIIEAAQKLFSEKGFYKTNSKEIADLAGVSIGTFYSYYKDKKDLFLDVVNLHFKQIFSNLLDSINNTEFIPDDKYQFVRSLIEPIAKAHETFFDLHDEINIMRHSDPDVKRKHEEYEAASVQAIITLLKKFKNIIQITDYATAAFLIAKIVDEIIHTLKRSQASGRNIDTESVLDELIKMIARYVFKDGS
ncbi:MAG: TetR/AcrR family transcriptional regulator [Spirochaetales bacterium]|nr:TetR/AcrR family transcriptional regulator [Spirochaetales bacterium]